MTSISQARLSNSFSMHAIFPVGVAGTGPSCLFSVISMISRRAPISFFWSLLFRLVGKIFLQYVCQSNPSSMPVQGTESFFQQSLRNRKQPFQTASASSPSVSSKVGNPFLFENGKLGFLSHVKLVIVESMLRAFSLFHFPVKSLL